MIIEKAKITKELLESLVRAVHDADGHEYNNPTPIEVTAIPNAAANMRMRIQRIVRHELSRQAESQGFETEEESNDFEVGDSFDSEAYSSKYEIMDEERPVAEAGPENGEAAGPAASETQPEAKPEGESQNDSGEAASSE